MHLHLVAEKMTSRHVKVMRKGLGPSPFSYLYGVMMSDMKNETKKGTQFPFIPILTLMFVAAKLMGYIDWSWWWVFCPIWIEAAISIAVLIVAGIGLLIMNIFN